ncbi:MAG: choice-of-anchor I family protein [Pseudomonadota bacterium]
MKFKQRALALAISTALGAGIISMAHAAVSGLNPIGRYSAGAYDEGAAEIVAYDKLSQRLFVVNASAAKVDVLNIADPSTPTKVGEIDPADAQGANFTGGSANSVSVKNGIMAVAIEADPKQGNGIVAFYRTTDLAFLGKVTVGALPDMLTFTPDGTKVIVANEGEPSSYGQPDSVDPEGSVSIIDLSAGVANATVQHATFTAFNAQEATLKAAGVRIFGPGATVAQDLEPEYIAVSADSATAWVTLQENNALAKVDIATATVQGIYPLGFKDHGVAGQGLDASNEDSATNSNSGSAAVSIRAFPGLYGMYQPDSIGLYTVGGNAYLITANEGDARDYTGFAEASLSASDLTFDAALDANYQFDSELDKLDIANDTGLGDLDGDTDVDALYAYGARSFSIWDTATLSPSGSFTAANAGLVHDSGDAFEQTTSALYPANFNASNTNNSLDNRSDNKGPEPEGLAIGTVEGKSYAFIGLERMGGVMMYDVSTPNAPTFVAYKNNRDLTITPDVIPEGTTAATPGGADTGDLGPEGLAFIPADQSPNGYPLLVVGNEISGTTTVYRIEGATKLSDQAPDAFTLADQTDVATSTVVISAAITPSGFDAATAISITDGEYSINGGDFMSSAAYITPGDSVQVRVTSASTAGAATSAVLTIGGVSDTFTVTTQSAASPAPSADSSSGGGAFGLGGILGLGLLSMLGWFQRRRITATAN